METDGIELMHVKHSTFFLGQEEREREAQRADEMIYFWRVRALTAKSQALAPALFALARDLVI